MSGEGAAYSVCDGHVCVDVWCIPGWWYEGITSLHREAGPVDVCVHSRVMGWLFMVMP